MRQTSTLARLAARLFGRNTDAVSETPAIVNRFDVRCDPCLDSRADLYFGSQEYLAKRPAPSMRPRSYFSSHGSAMPVMATRRPGSNPLPLSDYVRPDPPANPPAINESYIICKYGHLGDCCLERDHDGPHLFKCAGEYCPGLPWIASNTPHPTSCTIDFGDRDDQ